MWYERAHPGRDRQRFDGGQELIVEEVGRACALLTPPRVNTRELLQGFR
jgi:hypothetical protein